MGKVQVALAPEQLWQAINPWQFYQQGAQFGLVNISIGETPHPEIEAEVLDEVGSYGRQLGRIGDVLEVLMTLTDESKLTKEQVEIFDVLRGQIAQISRIKRRNGR